MTSHFDGTEVDNVALVTGDLARAEEALAHMHLVVEQMLFELNASAPRIRDEACQGCAPPPTHPPTHTHPPTPGPTLREGYFICFVQLRLPSPVSFYLDEVGLLGTSPQLLC